MKMHLNFILSYEESDEKRLNMLTNIGLETTSNIIFQATEEIRHNLSLGDTTASMQSIREKILSHTVVGRIPDGSEWSERDDEASTGEL